MCTLEVFVVRKDQHGTDPEVVVRKRYVEHPHVEDAKCDELEAIYVAAMAAASAAQSAQSP